MGQKCSLITRSTGVMFYENKNQSGEIHYGQDTDPLPTMNARNVESVDTEKLKIEGRSCVSAI